jgi:phosphatidylethanolamine/phosphatidyl-N-methylethanolamine N-methyltransferase
MSLWLRGRHDRHSSSAASLATRGAVVTDTFLEGMQFFRRFIGNPREVGALWPSSSRLAAEMVRDLALRPGDLVIEYGVGTGALTSAIAARLAMTPGSRYLGIEQDGDFCDRLRQRFPQLDFAQDRVENVEALRRARGLPAPRAILSGLPLVLMPTLRDIVLEAERSLLPGGEFRQFSYLLSWPTPRAFELRRLMRETFHASSCSALVPCNLPPAWVLRGRKAIGGGALTRATSGRACRSAAPWLRRRRCPERRVR